MVDISAFTDRMFKAAPWTSRGPLIYLMLVDYYDFTTQTIGHLYFGTDGYNKPDAPGYFQNRVMSAPNFGRFLLSPGATQGSGKITAGDVVLANYDRTLDHLRDYGIAGRQIRIMIGYKNDLYANFVQLTVGRVEQVLFEFVTGDAGTTDIITFRFRDRLLDFSMPIQNTRYLGTNDLPNGVEGTDDIKSKPKPLLYGQVYNISPPCVNTSLLIYQVADNQITVISAVRDSGAVIAPGAAYTSLADMQANAPDLGTYRPWISPAGSYFRLGTDPRGTLTCDAYEGGAVIGAQSAGNCVYRLLTTKGGLSPSDISASDLAILNTLNQAAVGIWIDGESNIQVPIDQLLQSIGAAGGFDRLDIYRMRRVNLPLAEHATGIIFRAPYNVTKVIGTTDVRLISIRFLPTNDPDKGVPTYEQIVNYRKNYTVQAGDGLSGEALADQALVNFVNTEFRTVVRDAAWVKVGNPLSVKKEMFSLLVQTVAAEEECERQLTLYSGRRDFLELEVDLSFENMSKFDIGDIITVIIPAYGYTEGQPMLITGMGYNTSNNILTVECWGGRESFVEDLVVAVSQPGPESRGFIGDTLVSWTGIGMLISPLGIDRAIIDYGVLESVVGLAT